jgi:hypothetical protein
MRFHGTATALLAALPLLASAAGLLLAVCLGFLPALVYVCGGWALVLLIAALAAKAIGSLLQKQRAAASGSREPDDAEGLPSPAATIMGMVLGGLTAIVQPFLSIVFVGSVWELGGSAALAALIMCIGLSALAAIALAQHASRAFDAFSYLATRASSPTGKNSRNGILLV